MLEGGLFSPVLSSTPPYIPTELRVPGSSQRRFTGNTSSWIQLVMTTFVPCPEYPLPAPCPECGLYKVHADQVFVAIGALCTTTLPGKNAIAHFLRPSLAVQRQRMRGGRQNMYREESASCLPEGSSRNIGSKDGSVSGFGGNRYQDGLRRHMTECITKWRQNGFKNSRGSYVANADLFNQIDILTGHLNVQNFELLF